MERFNKFLYGFIPGLILPVLFIWLIINRLYPTDLSFFEAMKELYTNSLYHTLLGKLLLLSVMPNLTMVFVFYKSDSFKIATGMMVSAMPYFIASIVML